MYFNFVYNTQQSPPPPPLFFPARLQIVILECYVTASVWGKFFKMISEASDNESDLFAVKSESDKNFVLFFWRPDG